MTVAYAYPSVSEVNRNGRGGLGVRGHLASDTGCDYVEMPAVFVKNKTKVELSHVCQFSS